MTAGSQLAKKREDIKAASAVEVHYKEKNNDKKGACDRQQAGEVLWRLVGKYPVISEGKANL